MCTGHGQPVLPLHALVCCCELKARFVAWRIEPPLRRQHLTFVIAEGHRIRNEISDLFEEIVTLVCCLLALHLGCLQGGRAKEKGSKPPQRRN